MMLATRQCLKKGKFPTRIGIPANQKRFQRLQVWICHSTRNQLEGHSSWLDAAFVDAICSCLLGQCLLYSLPPVCHFHRQGDEWSNASLSGGHRIGDGAKAKTR